MLTKGVTVLLARVVVNICPKGSYPYHPVFKKKILSPPVMGYDIVSTISARITKGIIIFKQTFISLLKIFSNFGLN